MNPTEYLAKVHADAERVQFCPHMDWTTSLCSGCRNYRLAQDAERLACAIEAVLDLCVLRDRGLALLDIDDETELFRAAIAEHLT